MEQELTAARVKGSRSLLEVDSRRRITLGPLATHDRYLASVEPDGTIVLTPAVVIAVAQNKPSTGEHR